MPQKIKPKNALFQPEFCSFFASKPLHIVVDLSHLPFKPQFVIRTILSTWPEPLGLMSWAVFWTLRLREHINGFLAFFPKTDVQGNKSTGVIAGLLYTSHGAK